MADAPAWDDIPSYDDLPDAPTSKGPEAKSAAPAWDDIPSWDDLPNKPAPEGELKTAGREFAHNVVPGIVGRMGMVPGAEIGAALGAPLGPIGAGVGALVGGAGGFLLGSLGADYTQGKVLDAMGENDDPQRQANRAANPKSAFAGGLAGGMVTMSPQAEAGTSIAKQLIARGTAGGAMAGFEAGGEKLNGEDLNPTNIAMAGAAGFLAPGTNALGRRVDNAVRKIIPGRPGVQATPEVEQARADVDAADDGGATRTSDTVGNPQSAPTRSEKNYGKGTEPVSPENDMLTSGDMDPATRQALELSTEKNALTTDEQTATIPQAQATPPEPELPMKTGIEEAAGVPNTASAVAALQVPKKGRRQPPQQVDAGFPKVNEEPRDAVAKSPVDPTSTSGLNTPGAPENEEVEAHPGRAAAIRASKGETVDAGFPKPGEALASYGTKPTIEDAMGKLTQPEKRGTTTPNDQLSDAQKRAGNYNKASVRDFGHDLKIETERGDMRRSLDDSPVKWEHESPADYGYFKKTIGADKDHVDFYRADPEMPEFGDKHFIVDQRNPETGKFDEHKVMNHFKDLDAARDTYVKAFGDGSGLSRLHDIKEISPEDLTKWLRTASKKKPYGEPMPKVKPELKVVTAAVTALKEAGRDADAAHLQTLPRERQGIEAARKLQELKTGNKSNMTTARIRSAAPKVDGLGVQAKDLEDAARKKSAVDAFQKVFDAHAPDPKRNSPETKAETIARARAGVEAAAKLDQYPMKMQDKKAPSQWVREAKKIIRRPTDEMLKEFRANEELLRSGREGDANEVKATNRIKADTELARGRGGDVADAAGDTRTSFEGAPGREETTELKPEPVKSAHDLSKLLVKNKELDLTKPDDIAKVAGDTKKIVANLIRMSDKDAGTRPVTNRAEEAMSLVQRGKAGAPLKRETKATFRSITDPDEMKRIVDAANERMAKKRATPDEETINKMDFTKEADIKPRDTKGIGGEWHRFLDDQSGAVNHKKIAADFNAKGNALRQGMEKYFGVPVGEVGKKIASVLAKAVATQDSLNAEKAGQLADRWFAWVKGTTKDEQWKYLKTLETMTAKTKPDIEAALVANGLPKEKAAWMSDEALFHKSIMDNIWLEDKKHGSTAEYLDNYVAHIFKNDRLAAEYLQELGVKNAGSKWYQKERTFDFLEQAQKAGFELKFSNPIDLIQARWAASIKSNMLVAAARGLREIGMAFPVKDAPKILLEREGWQFKRNLPDNQQWVFAPGAENLWINSMEPKGLNEMQNVVGSMYRFWMGIKRVWAPIQLAFSAFHELHVAANINVAQNLSRALQLSKNEFQTKGVVDAVSASLGHAWDATKWSLRDPLLALPLDKIPLAGRALDHAGFSSFEGRKLMDVWKTPLDQLNPTDRMWKRLMQEGGFSPSQSHEDVIGAKRDFAQAIADLKASPGVGPATRTLFNGLARGIEKLQEPMFKYQIPALKAVAYKRAVAAAIKMDPDLATNYTKRGVVLREIGKSIDNRFGEMFYKGLFWNKALKDSGIGSFLSLSWNLGQARELFGAGKELATGGARMLGMKQKPMADAIYKHGDKTAFVGSYVGLSMLSAGALSYALSGEFPTGLDYVFPRNGQKNVDGTPGRLSTPFNTREPFMLKAHAEQHNSWVGGAMEFLWNKMVLSPLVEIAQNKDFFGDKLYDPNASWYLKALQAADSTAGRLFNPISLSGADRAKQQGGGKTGQALAYAGFNPAPKYVEATPMQNRINFAYSQEGVPESKPYEYGPKTGLGRGLVQGGIRALVGDKTEAEARTEGRQHLRQGYIQNDPEAQLAARREMVEQGGLSARTGGKMQPTTEFEAKFAKLPKPTQAALARDMNAQEFTQYVMQNRTGGNLTSAQKAALIKDRSTNK